jgi:hypothetical protein
VFNLRLHEFNDIFIKQFVNHNGQTILLQTPIQRQLTEHDVKNQRLIITSSSICKSKDNGHNSLNLYFGIAFYRLTLKGEVVRSPLKLHIDTL